MKKRILSLALIVVMTMMLIPSAQASWTMFVCPSSGSTVNLRSTPNTAKNAKNLITKIGYGQPVTVKYISDGWACVEYEVGAYSEGYIMVKYLTYDYKAPTPANKKKSSSGGSQQQAAPVDLSAQFTNMNKQFRTFHKVDKPFIVYAKPKRATGWVNFRYAPNEKAERVRQVRQNEILTVIGQTDNWYQVEDPQTGIIGYISRTYVSTNPN